MENYFNTFNIFECGRKVLERIGVSYERACMENPKDECFTEMLHSLLKHNHCHGTPFSSKNLQEAVIRLMEEEEKDAERDLNNVTTNTLSQSSSL